MLAVRETPASYPRPRLLDRVRDAVRSRHYSRRTERPESLPTVLTRDEVRRVLECLEGTPRVIVLLLYGAGLRLLESAQLRIKDIDFAANQLVVRSGKGAKDRVTMLPTAAKTRLLAQIEAVRRQHRVDVETGAGWIALPDALVRKYPNAGRELGWQWVFPATRHYVEHLTGQRRRHHLHESVDPACRQARAAPGRRRQARELSHVPAFIRHALARGRSRHPDRPGAARPSRRQHDDDLHPRPEPRPVRCA